MFSAREGHFEILKTLLSSGCAVDIESDNGWTALMIAACYGFSDMAVALINAGADVNHFDEVCHY